MPGGTSTAVIVTRVLPFSGTKVQVIVIVPAKAGSSDTKVIANEIR
jgi:hypothetical protein